MLARIAMIAVAVISAFVIGSLAASAAPQRLIILRHGEKQNAYRLCPTGQQRALALAQNYLGRGSANTLFEGSDAPAAFIAITLHTLELASPAAMTWNQPLILYSALPQRGQSKMEFTRVLNQRTQEAVKDLMSDARWTGKTVVMVWEHDHIAQAKLEREFPSEEVTLRQLLNLDRLQGVPETWPGSNYDYFWIVDFDAAGTPTGFRMVKQEFPAPYQDVPSNDWGAPDGLSKASRCKS